MKGRCDTFSGMPGTRCVLVQGHSGKHEFPTATTSRRAPGRPASEFPERYQVRHTAEQMAAWQAAAEADGRTLQSWIRWTLDKAAKKAQRQPHLPPHPKPRGGRSFRST